MKKQLWICCFVLSMLFCHSLSAVEIKWLDAGTPAVMPGVTWGMPWARGTVEKGTSFQLKNADGHAVPVQTWPLAYWPDGSLKWTAHAMGPSQVPAASYELSPGASVTTENVITLTESDTSISVDTGLIQCNLAKQGDVLIRSVTRGDRVTAANGRLVLLNQNNPLNEDGGTVRVEKFTGRIDTVTVEQRGPIRAVVKFEGRHAGPNGRVWLPFVVRVYFYAGSDAVRMMHTMIYDGDESKDFIRGLGVRFDVPMKDALHDRHIRFVGDEDGVFGEAVRGLTGLRRDSGLLARQAQVAGEATPPMDTIPRTVSGRLPLIPAFGDYTLFQPTSDSFVVSKRTAAGHAWLKSGHGHRAAGFGYVGGPSGGVAFGLRNFWQSYPAQLDIRKAATETSEVTVWMWAPRAGPMDLRFYHDGMGQDTYPEQIEGLNITYEDYEPGFGTPVGVARTSELMLWATDATPARSHLVDMAQAVREPAMIVCSPEAMVKTGVFGGMWSLADRSIPARVSIEDKLDFYFDFYKNQVDQRRWYGFWDFGDVMHSYDEDRHVWRYDVGGYAWDNSELSTDIWLWTYYLHTGRADVFRMAEAMCRHTGEVDVHHLGRFAPLGSRHNVMHWGCSCKQLRISTAANRRYYYYLTGDERVGDLMREQIEAHRTLQWIISGRKGGRAKPDPNAPTFTVGFGTDWGALSAAWLTEWERTGDTRVRDRLMNSMRTIAAQPYGFFSSGSRINPDTGEYEIRQGGRAGASHLSAVFGLVEICAELVQLVDMPEFEKAWLQYCRLYNGNAEDQQAELGTRIRGGLQEGHSRLTAFAANRLGNADMAVQAWEQFLGGGRRDQTFRVQRIDGPDVLTPVDESPWVSTNGAAQWSLAAMQCLALVPDALPEDN